VKVTVEKIDDINIVISGEIEKKEIEANVEKLKADAEKNRDETKKELAKEMKDDALAGDEEKMVNDVLNKMGSENFEKDAEGMILQEFIEAGLKKANIPVDDILGQPGFKTYEQREDSLYLEIQISTTPEIDTDIDYQDIIPSYQTPEAPKEQVDEKLKEMVIAQAPFTSIEKPKAVEKGDVAVIDFEGFIDGVAFEGGSAEKFNIKVGSDSFIPGFEEQIEGMNYGEEKTITVTFPTDYSSSDLAGKEADFKVKLHEIQEQKYVEPDDAFAQKILGDTEATLDMLREKLAEQINSQGLSLFYQNELKPILVKGLLSKFDFTLPKNIVEQEIDAKINERAQNMSKEEHEEYRKNKDMFQQLRKKVEPEAKNAIKIALIVDALAKKEGISVDEHEIQAALYYQAMMSKQDPDALLKYYKEHNLMTSAKMSLTEDKLFGRMLGFEKTNSK